MSQPIDSDDLGKKMQAVGDWQSTVEGADIKPGALVMPYGTISAIELSLTDIMSKLVVDDWGQVGAETLTRETLPAEMGAIIAGLKPGRGNEAETILCWHRGLSLSDSALGQAMITRGKRLGIGQCLRFA